MWSFVSGKIKLDRSKIGPDFRILSENGLYLITPRKNLWEWKDEERLLRSIVVDEEGFVVSSSWRKFGNYGEFKDETLDLDNALKDGEVNFTAKMDGSLAIRSVINGKIIFRTRGMLYERKVEGYNSFVERFEAVARNKYPILFDETFMPDRSLLFEYIAPTNLIVIRYEQEDLIFLGFVKHDNLEIGKWKEVSEIAKNYNFNLVKSYELPRNPKELLDTIKDWTDEGIVARCNDDQVFVKIKSAFYLAGHRLKYSINYLDMVKIIEECNITNEKELLDYLQLCDYDWEIRESAKEIFNRYLKAVELKNLILKRAEEVFNNFIDSTMDERERKKNFALYLNGIDDELINFIRPVAFCLYDNRKDKLEKFCGKLITTEGNF